MVTLPAPAPMRAEEGSAGPVRPAHGPVPSEPSGRGGSLLEVWLAPVLLLVAWTAGWIGSRTWLHLDHVLWALVPSIALLGLRAVLELVLRRTGPDSAPLAALYGLHLLLVLCATVLNPMTCIYAFVGYLDSSRFLHSSKAWAVVVATALLSAVGQVGGVQVVREESWFFGALAVVNLLIALGMMHLALERESMIAQREDSIAELVRVHGENDRLHDQLIAGARRAGADEERTRLSREIHDTVAQGLVGVIRQLEAVAPDIDPGSRHRVAVAEEAARDCLLEARRAVEALGPHQLHDTDVVEALSGLVARWARSHRVVATFDADEAPGEGAHGDVLVRLMQESLANVARHAEASTVTATLVEDGAEQLLSICDDGIGFDPQTAPRGHGLGNMTERVRAVGGRLEVVSTPGHGCTITARLPR